MALEVHCNVSKATCSRLVSQLSVCRQTERLKIKNKKKIIHHFDLSILGTLVEQRIPDHQKKSKKSKKGKKSEKKVKKK